MTDLEGSPQFCRVCLKAKTGISSIYEYRRNKFLPTVIYNISGVKILPSTEPAAQICMQCAISVLAAEIIILRCQESDEYLDRRNPYQCTTVNESADASLSEHNPLEKVEIELKENSSNSYVTDMVDRTIKREMIGNDDAPLTAIEKEIPDNILLKICQHSRKSTNGSQFNCDRCSFQTKTGKLFVAHKREKHKINDPNIYCCTFCTERFSWKPKLYRHIQIDHNTLPDDKTFLCNECGNAYTREVHLFEHTKQRHGPRRFKCADPNCEQTFTRAFTLRRHYLAAHATNTRYHCSDCDKYFKIYDLWKYHNEVVHKNETVYCPQCGYPFRHKEKLEEHLEKEVCKRCVIPCRYCQRRFTTKGGLREHLKNIHRMA